MSPLLRHQSPGNNYIFWKPSSLLGDTLFMPSSFQEFYEFSFEVSFISWDLPTEKIQETQKLELIKYGLMRFFDLMLIPSTQKVVLMADNDPY